MVLATTVADFARRAWQPALCVRVRAHPPTTHKAWWEYEEQLARLAFDLRGASDDSARRLRCVASEPARA